MKHSDDQLQKDGEDTQSPFQHFIPRTTLTPGTLKICQKSLDIQKRCIKLMNKILQYRMERTAAHIEDMFRNNCTQQFSLIFAVHFKRNQQKDLPKFVQTFFDRMQRKNKIPKKYQNVTLLDISKTDVRDIALDLHIKQEESFQKMEKMLNNPKQYKEQDIIDPRTNLNFYINKKITNLSNKNLHVFERNIIEKKFCVLLPTFQDMKIIDGHGIVRQNQKFFFQAYNNKQLFCQFVYKCLKSTQIKAYLPKQILNLITDLKYYPISYHQSCRRFIYAIQMYDKHCQMAKKPEKKYVVIKDLVQIYNKLWETFLQYGNNQSLQINSYEKLTKCILDQNELITVNQNMIDNIVRLSNNKDSLQKFTQSQLYRRFARRFKRKLQQNETLAFLAKQLDEFDQKQEKMEKIKSKRNKNDRGAILGFQKTRKFRTEKELFEDKITKIFKVASQAIRIQANQIKWQELKFQEHLKPQFVKEIAEAMLGEQQFRDIYDAIRSHMSVPLAKIIHTFPKYSIGRIIYVIRCLELKGAIEINKNTIKPSITTNYFQKSQFRLQEWIDSRQ